MKTILLFLILSATAMADYGGVSNVAVITKLLTGLDTTTVGTCSAADTILSCMGKLVANGDGTALTASRAVVTNSLGSIVAATTTAAEINFVNGVTSSIQTQLNTKKVAATQIVVGSPCTTSTSVAAVTYGTLTGVPTLTFTATRTATFLIKYSGPFFLDGATSLGDYYTISIAATAGSPTLVYKDEFIGNTDVISDDFTGAVGSLYTLTAGVSYSFVVQGAVGTVTTTVLHTDCGAALGGNGFSLIAQEL